MSHCGTFQHALGISTRFSHNATSVIQDVAEVLNPLPQLLAMRFSDYQIYDDVNYEGHIDHLNQIKGTKAL